MPEAEPEQEIVTQETSHESEELSVANSTEGPTSMQLWGVILTVSGLALAAYFFLFYDTSVSTESIPGQYIAGHYIPEIPSESVENIGKLNRRQNGITLGVGLALLGGVLLVGNSIQSNQKKSEQAAP